MKYLILFILLFYTSIIEVHAQDGVDISKVHLENFYKVEEEVYRGSQPNEDQFEALESAGFVEVLNLRRFNSDNKEAKDTDIILHHIPVKASRIGEGQFLEALKVIKN